LVVYTAQKFENTNVLIEDLISIGTIGLIKAVESFDNDKNIKLATYASRCIENEILMYLRKINQQKGDVSLDEPLNTDWEGNELLLSDVLGSDGYEINNGIEDEDERRILHLCMESLGERERLIMNMRFGLCGYNEHTQKEVADILGISQSYISRLEKRIITQLKKDIEKITAD
jgi:RNA polymerase sporulation-specific sigma factor